jgi:hypothetical protein
MGGGGRFSVNYDRTLPVFYTDNLVGSLKWVPVFAIRVQAYKQYRYLHRIEYDVFSIFFKNLFLNLFNLTVWPPLVDGGPTMQ